MSINWSDAVDTAAAAPKTPSGPYFPAGAYKMIIDGAGWDYTTTGKDRLNVRFMCTEGEKRGKYISWGLVYSPDNPKAVAFFLDKLATLGITGEYLRSNPSSAEIAKKVALSTDTFKVSITVARRTVDDKENPGQSVERDFSDISRVARVGA